MGLFDRWTGAANGLDAQLNQAKAALERSYAALGRAYYQRHSDAPSPEEEGLFAGVAAAEEMVRNIERDALAAKGRRRCPHCGEIISNQISFCSNCGKRVAGEDEIPCPHCRRPVDRNTAFCPFCGKPVAPAAPAASAARFCISCGTKVEDPEAAFCPECGAAMPRVYAPAPVPAPAPAPQRVCPRCGTAMGPDEVFCPNCGCNTAAGAEPPGEESAFYTPPAVPRAAEERADIPEEPATRLWMPADEADLVPTGAGGRVCPECGHAVGPEESFCDQCGCPVPMNG